jgi:hypothetical protein
VWLPVLIGTTWREVWIYACGMGYRQVQQRRGARIADLVRTAARPCSRVWGSGGSHFNTYLPIGPASILLNEAGPIFL